MPEYYVGLMSGTSIDAIDAALLETSGSHLSLNCYIEHPIPEEIKADILSLCSPGDNEIERMGKLDNQLAELFAIACNTLIKESGLSPTQINAIGSHGQTIRHMPDIEQGFTLQIGNPALIAERTGITTVADFRRADMAAGGQGAPLAPAFHQAAFADPQKNRVILNIGGMANISILQNNSVSGFDTGPGNVLLDCWTQLKQNKAYDENGDWARQFQADEELLKLMLDDNYFHRPPPKSTGREHFNQLWLDKHLTKLNKELPAGIVQATLTELSARSIADAIQQYAACDEVYVCGGGAYNRYLIGLLKQKLQRPIQSTEALGIHPGYVEAAAFAWFARQTLHGLSSNAPTVTGARHSVIQGAIYPR